jgi:hypothetical protein
MKVYAFYYEDELLAIYESPITAMRALLNCRDKSDSTKIEFEGRLSTHGYCKLLVMGWEWYSPASIYEVGFFRKK